MNWKISLPFFLFLFISCHQKKTEKETSSKQIRPIKSAYLIEADELQQIIDNKNIKIIDFRKKEFYNQEHMEGAVQMWRSDIEDTSYAYGGMKATAQQIEKLFGSLGISTNDTIIVYDNKGLCEASRLWWVLQNYQFKHIKMLHGGLESWKSIQGAVSSKTTEVQPAIFELPRTENTKFTISKAEVLKALQSKNIKILDTRTLDEFNGKVLKKGAAKAGRIPNSIHKDWAEAIDYHGTQKLKSIENLNKIYRNQLGLKNNDSIILYCHSGVRSAHTSFVLSQIMGFKNVRNYDGSWTEWSHFNELPVDNSSSLTNIN